MDPLPQNTMEYLYTCSSNQKLFLKKDMLGKAMVGAFTSSNSPDFKLQKSNSRVEVNIPWLCNWEGKWFRNDLKVQSIIYFSSVSIVSSLLDYWQDILGYYFLLEDNCLQHSVGFCLNQHESAIGAHVPSLLSPLPHFPSPTPPL